MTKWEKGTRSHILHCIMGIKGHLIYMKSFTVDCDYGEQPEPFSGTENER